MRIAYFVDSFPMISETFVLGQITGMIDRGHEVTIFANRLLNSEVRHKTVDQYQLRERTMVIPWVPRNPVRRVAPALRGLVNAVKRRRLGVAMRALNFVKFGRKALGLGLFIQATGKYDQVSFDVIHCQFGQLGVMAEELRQCGAIEGFLVASFRGADAMKYASRDPGRFSRLFNFGDKFLAVSAVIQKRLIDIGCPADRIDVLRSGINLKRFRLREHRKLCSPVRLISVGRLAPNKGIGVALHAVRLLRDSGIDIRYRVLGAGPCEADLVSQVSELGIESVVTFEGAVNSGRVIEALSESDILLAPTVPGPDGDQEGLPNCLKEAMAIGVIAIGTEMGSIPELVTDGVSGYVAKSGDAPSLAASVESAIRNWDHSATLIAEGRRAVESEYDIDRLNDVLEGIYQDLVTQR